MSKINKAKRKYEEKLKRQLALNREFLIERMRQDWDEIQKTARRERLIEQTKTGGKIMAKTFLILLAIGGAVTVAAVAPNILGAIGVLGGRKNFFRKHEFNKVKNHLAGREYIRANRRDGLFEINITEKGLKYFLGESFRDFKIVSVKRWDGFWRIVIFDIPNRHKWARDGFRQKLKSLGFYQLQESVFVMPYPCEKEIDFLVSVFNLADYVYFIKTQYLSNDDRLKKTLPFITLL